MTSQFLTPSEDSARFLQEAAQAGFTVMIPGAWEPRVGRPASRPAGVTTASVAPHAHAVVMGDRERLEHEREGGGAPSERRLGRHQTLLARLWHGLRHPADFSMIWHPLPEEGG